MALYTGVTGSLKVGTTEADAKAVLHMSTWSVSLSKDIHEVVSFGNEYKEKLPGIKDWTASADGAADFATESEQKALLDAFESGELIYAQFMLNNTTFLKGSSLVESLDIEHDAEGHASVSISLSGSNAVTLTLPAVGG